MIPTYDKIYNNLNIPMLLISKHDGEILKNQIEDTNDVLATIDLDID